MKGFSFNGMGSLLFTVVAPERIGISLFIQTPIMVIGEDNLIMIHVETQPTELYSQIHDLIRMAFPDRGLICSSRGVSDHISITVDRQGDCIVCKGEVQVEGRITRESCQYSAISDQANVGVFVGNISRRFVLTLLRHHLGQEINPYGILTGVRPVKIVHRLLDQDWEQAPILAHLQDRFLINQDKARLLLEVAAANRPFLLDRERAKRLLSVYIGIPFCPSRCRYCSFPANRIHNYDLDVGPFVQALLTEMRIIGKAIAGLGWQVEAVYIGGGTPTVLSAEHLESIFEVLHQHYISAATREITVEAGRPDTITQPGLNRMRRLGVDRVCVNPQTMDEHTLRLIGRNHDAQMVREAVEQVRQAGIKYINMDLIVGLPGESLSHFQNTAIQVLELDPDNITIHSLAAKRGADLFLDARRPLPKTYAEEVVRGMEWLDHFFREHGFKPYYLYRQKHMRANLENIGYEQGQSPCIYNIQMIEERQTIIGLGGGANSKYVRPHDFSLVTLQNPKNPQTYIETVEALAIRKVDKLQALL